MGCSEEKSVRFAVEDYIRHLQPHIKQIVSGVVPEGAKNQEFGQMRGGRLASPRGTCQRKLVVC